MYRDRGLTRSFAERAQAAGYQALVLTIDNQVLGQRERDVRNGFTIPPRVTWRSGLDAWRGVPWLLRMAQGGKITLANYVTDERKDILSLARHINELLDPALCWQDVAWLREIWSGPLILKGVLHPDEARAAIDHGVDGVIVSNHGGRQLDTAMPSIRALPAVADAVAGRIPVLIDGGIRRGSHVVKAVALGATACLIGRPHLWGMAVAGEAGVAAVLDIYRRDIDRVLALGGWDGIGEVDRRALAMPPVAGAKGALVEPGPVADLARRRTGS
jgi:L-lactate dehydrogenase (cytochrome)/(S)-mandelate dehydrogenase